MTPEEFGALQQSHADLKSAMAELKVDNGKRDERIGGLQILVRHMRDQIDDSAAQIEKIDSKVGDLGEELASNSVTTSRVEQALGTNTAATNRVEQNTKDLVEAFGVVMKLYKGTAWAGKFVKEWAWLAGTAVAVLGSIKGWWSKLWL